MDPVERPEARQADRSEIYRRQRGKNIALLLVLLAFVALIYVIAMVRMSGGAMP